MALKATIYKAELVIVKGEQKLSVFHVSAQSAKDLAGMAAPSMSLQCSIQDGEIWFRDDKEAAVQVVIEQA